MMLRSVEAAPEASSDSEAERDASDETAPDVPKKTIQPETVFGREVVSENDVRAIAREARNRLVEAREKSDVGSAYEAARLLANAKLAGLEIGDLKKRKDVFDQLVGHVAEGRENTTVLERARYLGRLKYLGAIDTIDESDAEAIKLAAVTAESDGDAAELEKVSLWGKYLGVQETVTTSGQALLQKRTQRLAAEGEAEAFAMSRARLNYLEVATGMTPEELKDAEASVDVVTAQAAAEKDWAKFTRLRVVEDSVRGSRTVADLAKEGIQEHVATLRSQAEREGSWARFTSYLSEVAKLSRDSERMTETKPTTRDEETMQFLGNLAEQDEVTVQPETTEKPKDFLRKLGEQERAAAGDQETVNVAIDPTTVLPQPDNVQPAAEELSDMQTTGERRVEQLAGQAQAQTEKTGFWARLRGLFKREPAAREPIIVPAAPEVAQEQSPVAKLVEPPVVAELVKPPPVAKVTGDQETAAPEAAETKADPKSTAGGESFVIEVGAHIPGTGAREVSAERNRPEQGEEIVTARFRDKEGNTKPPVVKPPIIAESTTAAAAETQAGEADGDDMSVFEGMETHGQRRVREYTERKNRPGIFTRAWRRLFGPRPQGQSWSRWQKVRRSQSGIRGLFFRGRKRRKAFEARYGTDSEAKKYLGDLAEQERVQETTKLAAQDKKPSDSDSPDSNLRRAA